ncbi:MAG: PAS domain S-box protein [Balneolaceae bacterium]
MENKILQSDFSFFESEPMIVYDPGTLMVLDVNEKALEKYGYERTDFLSRKITELGERVIQGVQKERSEENSRHVLDSVHTRQRPVWKLKGLSGRLVQFSTYDIEYNGRPVVLAIAGDQSEAAGETDSQTFEQFQPEEDPSDRSASVNDFPPEMRGDGYRMSLKSFETLFDSIEDAIYIQDREGRFLQVNKGAVKMYGYEKEFFINKFPDALAAPGKVDPEETYKYFQRALKGEPQRYEWWGRRKNGEIFPKEIQLNSGTYFGQKVVIAIGRDTTEQYYRQEKIKENEELFRQLFRNSPMGIAMLDDHKEIKMVNSGFEEIFGYEMDEILGLDINKLLQPEDAGDETATGDEVEIYGKQIRKDGSSVDVLMYDAPVVVGGKIIAIFNTFVDITDRKKAEEKVIRSLREKEILLAEIHHRVKNNLAVIIALLELQSNKTKDDNARKVLKDSQSRINSMALIHEKLYQNENLGEIQFDLYIEELLNVISSSHLSNDRKVKININADSIPLTITQAIPCGLLLNEIVTNSLKHAFPHNGSGEINISFKRLDNRIKYTVADNGIGLPGDFMKNKSRSLGMTLINTFSKQLEADLYIDTENGTRFDLIFAYDEMSASRNNRY